MLRLSNKEYKDLFENAYNPELFKLNEELSAVDKLLNDEELLQPYKDKFYTKRGRPTVPVSTYLRLMYLKYRYQLGYETLVAEVGDSLKWRRFCQIPLNGEVPDSTTLIKLTHKYGQDTIEEINKLLLGKLKKQKVIRGKKLRVDTTVVESDIHYPTDAGLLADGIRKITKVIAKIKSKGAATKTKFRNRWRSVKKNILKLHKNLHKKGYSKTEAVKERTKIICKIAKEVIADAKRIKGNIRKHLQNKKEATDSKRLLEQLSHFIKITEQVKSQTQEVLSGAHNIPNRIISIFDPQARPIKKGKLSRSVEFGRKVLLQESEKGIVTGYKVLDGNPADSTLLLEVIEKHKEIFYKPPEEFGADRAFASLENEQLLKREKVKRISIPKRGKPSKERKKYERQYWFKRLQRFRVGSEAKISLLKRKFDLRRSRFRGTEGTNIHLGWGILTHNLWQTVRLS